MKKIIIISASVLIGILGCSESTDQKTSQPERSSIPAEQKREPTSENSESLNKINLLVDFYENTETFPINVSTKRKRGSMEFIAAGNEGKEIPQDLLPVFNSLIEGKPDAHHTEVYATRRFSVSDSTIGLLTRVPGFYWPSKIILFVVDTQSGNIIANQEVAENTGDAGESLMLETKINKESAEKNISMQISKEQCSPTDETLEKSTCVNSILTYEINSEGIHLIDEQEK